MLQLEFVKMVNDQHELKVRQSKARAYSESISNKSVDDLLGIIDLLLAATLFVVALVF